VKRLNLNRAMSPSVWRDVLTECYWTTTTSPADVPGVLDLPKLHGRRVRIRWPKEYSWPKCAKWLDPLKKGLGDIVPIRLDSSLETSEGAILIELEIDTSSHLIAIDYSDYPKLNEDFVNQSAVYFKMQYANYGYQSPKVLPGGFMVNDLALYRYLPHLWKIQRTKQPIYDVYGRFGASFATQIRSSAVKLLNKQRRFEFEGSLKIIRYSRFLREVARSKVCLNLPGNGDLCFRLFDYFAVGACVVSPPINTTLPAPLVDRQHIAFVQPDLSDLLDVCDYYVKNKDERQKLQHNSREYFIRKLHYKALAHYYLKHCLDELA
jgi:hypothetical protein